MGLIGPSVPPAHETIRLGGVLGSTEHGWGVADWEQEIVRKELSVEGGNRALSLFMLVGLSF